MYHCDTDFKSIEYYEGLFKSSDNFMFYNDNWDYREFNGAHRTLTLIYFAFTSLSTVGFGDYYPVNDQERVVGSFVMLFGVAAFSYCAGELLVMVDNLQQSMDDNIAD